MRAARMLTLLAFGLAAATHRLAAQAADQFRAGQLPPQSGRNSSPRITGSVSGTVFFADTQRPARFAYVQLIPVGSLGTAGVPRGGGGGGAGAQSGLDGSFLIENVEVGDYYLSAFATGYLSPATMAQSEIAAGANADDVLRQLTVVHVSQGVPSDASLTLARGGVISGSAAWDDGSPAAGVQIAAASPTTQQRSLRAGFQGFGGNRFFGGGAAAMTDDRGRFRLMGLAPGDYTVSATVQAPLGVTAATGRPGFNRSASLSVFAPDKLRRSDADVVKLSSGEEHDGVTISLNLNALHTVSGRIASAGGSPVTGGQVHLVDATDSTLSRFAEIGTDGSFTIAYVPAGTYNLTLNARASASPSGGNSNAGQSFPPLQQTLAVADGDLSGLTFTVAPAVTSANR